MRAQLLQQPLLWIDCEMTGLNLNKDKIIEIAAILTNGALSTTVEGPSVIIQQPKSLLDGMDEWCTEHHGQSGLTSAVLSSKTTTVQAEDQLITFLQAHTLPEDRVVLAGNSVHVDRQFLQQEMPRLMGMLHYRIIDVSTIKEVASRWYTRAEISPPKKGMSHRALDDILESIQELKYYRSTIFRPTGTLHASKED
ncbi:REX2, RNA exonuclease 2 [Piptocephalis cylindrospora]|uniref:REX2, RNA exonuclease 2 n=1 Tax=Piptocephalis cylindrospora TaxID=1907219 RepID=A0A4P9Y3B3_9FUNG|nr:REX2, RNA exonuclease 2 [Piptocephalis cylindrospora]|eukprot:RKP13387.1 REX2, RNA exonuclease 2 [Piptocephalis cylindrospora]